MRALTPVEKRVALLLASRARGLACTIAGLAFFVLITRWTFFLLDFAFGMIALFVATPLVLAPSRDEMVGPRAALWLQKPVGELRFVLARFAEATAAAVGVAVLVGAAALAYGELALGWEPPRPLHFVLPTGALASFVTASIAFGTAAWLPRGSRATVLALLIFSLYVHAPEMAQPDQSRGGLVAAAKVALFPAPDLLRVALGMTGDVPRSIRPLLACLAHAAGWIVVGTLGIRRSIATGRIAR